MTTRRDYLDPALSGQQLDQDAEARIREVLARVRKYLTKEPGVAKRRKVTQP